MAMPIRFLIGAIGALFMLIGLLGVFSPGSLANQLGLSILEPAGASALRAMVGAHYIAMGGVCLHAVWKEQTNLLLPIGIIEAAMVLARLIGFVHGEIGVTILAPTLVEIVAAVTLIRFGSKS